MVGRAHPVAEFGDGAFGVLLPTGNSNFSPLRLDSRMPPYPDGTSLRSEPFPDETSLQVDLYRLRARLDDSAHHYAHGRAANNLAGALVWWLDWKKSFELIQEAEVRFVDMLNDGSRHQPEHVVQTALVAVRYNAAVVFQRGPDIGGNYAKADNFRALGFETLEEIAEHDRDQRWAFLHSALSALPVSA